MMMGRGMILGWSGEDNLTETNKFLSVALKKKQVLSFEP